jgi:hypothetical protein
MSLFLKNRSRSLFSWNDGINVNALAMYRTWMIQQHAKAQAKAKVEADEKVASEDVVENGGKTSAAEEGAISLD